MASPAVAAKSEHKHKFGHRLHEIATYARFRSIRPDATFDEAMTARTTLTDAGVAGEKTETRIASKIRNAMSGLDNPVILVIGSDDSSAEGMGYVSRFFPDARTAYIYDDKKARLPSKEHIWHDTLSWFASSRDVIAAVIFSPSAFKTMTNIGLLFARIEKRLVPNGVFICPMLLFRGHWTRTDEAEPTIDFLNQVTIPKDFTTEKEDEVVAIVAKNIFNTLEINFTKTEIVANDFYPFFRSPDGDIFSLQYFVSQKA
ncbi:MAG: hypothetical protein Hyperionvirus3_146 [Hyperionvirus sp.]|uniref:Uncharacterized protein n=1 Tax=Hyperionvirus sp. TaxID=2487770 RepID=A0A3G5A6W4_9VIRU|nr:MAG: hypothetical protein Hyperionvirus3_146 [Hyperionvirus sp.]